MDIFEIALVGFVIYFIIWFLNQINSIRLADRLCEDFLEQKIYDADISGIFEFYCSEWFGFKHWFVSYKEDERN